MMLGLAIIDKQGNVTDQKGYDNCLACHNTTKRFDEPRVTSPDRSFTSLQTFFSRQANGFKEHSHGSQESCGESCRTHELDRNDSANSFTREGVGCAACHGPSEHWLGTHFTAAWSPVAAEGFVNNQDLYVRARMCASCHVGDDDRDMNHDIIAAGHPPLRYELATYHAWLPKHWRDAEASDKTFYEAQLWIAGQVAATDASLTLLKSRAEQSHSVSIWPELASYDCASCHHDLGLENARTPNAGNRKAQAIYSKWNDSGIRWVIESRRESGTAGNEDIELIESLDYVKHLMEANSIPNANEVGLAAENARISLDRWLNGPSGVNARLGFRSDDLGRLVASSAGKQSTFETWEGAVQWYLAAVASRESWPGGWSGPLQDSAKRLQRGLGYPAKKEISRFAVTNSGINRMSREQAQMTAVDLARWLGKVSVDLESSFAADQQATAQLEYELGALIEELRELNKQDHAELQERLKELLEKRQEELDRKKKDKRNNQPSKPVLEEEDLFEEQEKRFGVPAKKQTQGSKND
ncbi:hypothetical protein [Rubripirellula obstinata]|nr:hypothetical protein [Rubripirellula obstinata]